MSILTLFGVISGALVVTSVSTVYSVLWLVVTFIIISMLLGLLNLGFPALLYVIVYVGAIAILFLFVIQLLDLGKGEQQNNNNYIISQDSNYEMSNKDNNYKSLVSPIILSVILGSLIVYILINDSSFFTSQELSVYYSTNFKQVDFSNGAIQVKDLSNWLYGPGLLPLIIVSIILLIAMVAPITLCKDKNLD